MTLNSNDVKTTKNPNKEPQPPPPKKKCGTGIEESNLFCFLLF